MEPPIEEQGGDTSIDPKKLKRMKKKLDELNRKVRHSRKKHDGMIHKRNALRKAIADVKSSSTRPTIEPEWNFTGCERAFGGAYRSCSVNGRLRMDYSTFFSRIRGGLIDLIKRELTELNLARVQTAVWIRFIKDHDRVELAFNSRMTNVH